MADKTPGQLAYEEDVRRCPFYHDGTPRPAWAELMHVARDNWRKYPTPRDWSDLPADSPHLTGRRREPA